MDRNGTRVDILSLLNTSFFFFCGWAFPLCTYIFIMLALYTVILFGEKYSPKNPRVNAAAMN